MNELPGTQMAASAPKSQVGPFVPLWGVGAALLVIVALIVAIVSNSVYWLQFFHVFGGALWISIDLFMGFIISPIMGRLDIPARMVFAKNLMTKMMVVMPTVVISTLASGWQVARLDNLFTTPYSPQHGWILAGDRRRD